MLRHAAFALCLVLGGAVSAQQATDAIAPEAATAGGALDLGPEVAAAYAARDAGTPAEATDWMIAAANPHAVLAGARVLRAGGTAADALVAVQVVLGLVEPQSSGLGGGGFLLYWDATEEMLVSLDGRETAPLAATPRLFQTEDGQTLGFFDAVVGGLSVGVPGTPALLGEAHARWGVLPWSGLFDDAIALADTGFAVSPRMAALVAADAERLARFPDTASYFLPGGVPLAEGDILRNPAYAGTLRALASGGAGAFYDGPIARDIVAAVQGAPGRPGLLSGTDLAIYRVKDRDPVCVPYRVFLVCGMGPSSSGGLAVGQILGLLAPYDLAALGPGNPEAWRLIGDASRLAFADRGLYVADSDFVPVPAKGLIDPAYLRDRARLLDRDDALPEAPAGSPPWDHAGLPAPHVGEERPSTTHVVIVDAAGNVASMTASIENAFGSRLMAGGFLLNNQLTDFSFRSHADGVPVANRAEPGKRPRSSMAPTMVLRDGAPVLALGSPGGSRIIGYVAKTIIAWADWGLDIQSAVSLPHAVNRFGDYDVEAGTDAEALLPALRAMGFKAEAQDLNSGLHAIEIGAILKGAADPRREGIALGD